MSRFAILLLALLAVPAVVRGDAFGQEPPARDTVQAPPTLLYQGVEYVRVDPDSLYQMGRALLAREEYRPAAEWFASMLRHYPESHLVPDALYWKAFALYRLDGSEDLERAASLLERLREEHPESARLGDARSLQLRLQTRLAQRGDPDASAQMARAMVALSAAQLQTGEVRGALEILPTRMVADTPVRPVRVERMDVQARAWMDRALRSAEMAGNINELNRRLAAGVRPQPFRVSGALRPAGLPDGCDREEYELRMAALNAVMQMNRDAALPTLRRVLALEDECSLPLRRHAVLLLGQQRDPEAEGLLVDLARNDPDATMRRQAVFALAQLGTDAAFDVLEEVLRTTEDAQTRNHAVSALMMHRTERTARLVRELILEPDTDERLRNTLILLVGQSGSLDDVAFLRNIFPQMETDALRRQVLQALAIRRGEENMAWVLDVAADPSQSMEVRRHAITVAGMHGAPVGTLIPLYDAAPDLRQQILTVLGQRIQDDAALEKLIEVARTGEEPALRRNAVMWLANSEDPRAQQALLDLITGGR